MATEEPVIAPDQRKPERVNLWRAGWLLAIALTLVMLIGNHTGRVEDLWLLAIAGTIAAGLVADWWMRRTGLKR